MFGYYEEGIEQKVYTKVFTINDLAAYIQSHPRKEDIIRLHQLKYKSEDYIKLKKRMPCITPAGLFREAKESNQLIQLSDYLYFDIDAMEVKGTIDDYKNSLIKMYKQHISLLGKSIGGRGLFFYVKVLGLTSENYKSVYHYLQTTIFKDVNTDIACKNVNRSQFIPYDPKLYFNHNSSTIEIPSEILNSKTEKRDTQHINNRESCYTLKVSFLPIDEILEKIRWTSYEYEGDKLFEINPIDFVKLYIPKEIQDDKKHTTFRALVNVLMYINKDINLITIQSFINYVNTNHTTKRMQLKEMMRTTEAEYDRIVETGDINVPNKMKSLHFNKSCMLTGVEKREMASKINGLIKIYQSISSIRGAEEQLIKEGKKISVKNIAELSKLSRKTIERHKDKSPIEIEQQIESLNATLDETFNV